MRRRAGGIEAVGRLVEDHQFRAVHDGLGELGHLFHAQRIGPQFAVARLAETDVEQHLVRLLEGRLRAGSPESSAIRRRRVTAVMLAMNESVSGM